MSEVDASCALYRPSLLLDASPVVIQECLALVLLQRGHAATCPLTSYEEPGNCVGTLVFGLLSFLYIWLFMGCFLMTLDNAVVRLCFPQNCVSFPIKYLVFHNGIGTMKRMKMLAPP